jgi:hypothetical protein
MGNLSTTNESSFDVLEAYFTKYPDVPKETILKQHLLSWSRASFPVDGSSSIT